MNADEAGGAKAHWHRPESGRAPPRQQAHATQAEQRQRIEVAQTAQQPPMQAGHSWAVPEHGLDRPDPVSAGDRLPGTHRGPYGQVGGAQRTVDDRDDTVARQFTREGDPAGARGVHRLARAGAQVHASMPRHPRQRRWIERPQNRRPGP